MSDSSPASGTPAASGASALSSGDGALQQEIDQMNAAFAFAIKANLEITTAKTIDGALETAAQQRPNIG